MIDQQSFPFYKASFRTKVYLFFLLAPRLYAAREWRLNLAKRKYKLKYDLTFSHQGRGESSLLNI